MSFSGGGLVRRIGAARKVDPALIREMEVEGFNHLPGDAGKSRSEFFLAMSRRHGAALEAIEIAILCPEFLRDRLRLTVDVRRDGLGLQTSY